MSGFHVAGHKIWYFLLKTLTRSHAYTVCVLMIQSEWGRQPHMRISYKNVIKWLPTCTLSVSVYHAHYTLVDLIIKLEF